MGTLGNSQSTGATERERAVTTPARTGNLTSTPNTVSTLAI